MDTMFIICVMTKVRCCTVYGTPAGTCNYFCVSLQMAQKEHKMWPGSFSRPKQMNYIPNNSNHIKKFNEGRMVLQVTAMLTCARQWHCYYTRLNDRSLMVQHIHWQTCITSEYNNLTAHLWELDEDLYDDFSIVVIFRLFLVVNDYPFHCTIPVQIKLTLISSVWVCMRTWFITKTFSNIDIANFMATNTTTTKPNNKQKETNSSLQHKANVHCACAFLKRLRGYFIYDHTVQVVDEDVNQKEHEDERVQQ